MQLDGGGPIFWEGQQTTYYKNIGFFCLSLNSKSSPCGPNKTINDHIFAIIPILTFSNEDPAPDGQILKY